MSGKSTYLRQNALIVLMAQNRFFWPAQQAIIGIVDKDIFTRIAPRIILQGAVNFPCRNDGNCTYFKESTKKSFILWMIGEVPST